MIEVTSTEFQNKVGKYQDKALQAPITVTKHGEPHVVMISAAEYERLKKLDRLALHPSQLSPALLEALDRAEASTEARAFDYETSGR